MIDARYSRMETEIDTNAFYADGDPIVLYTSIDGNDIILTDHGVTRMRLSFSLKRERLWPADKIEALAERHGFSYTEGVIYARVSLNQIYRAVNNFIEIVNTLFDKEVLNGR